MSQQLEFDGYWEGDVVYNCDNCSSYKTFRFDSEDIDYRENNRQLRNEGWVITQVNGKWRDFCCEECRNSYIRKYTR